MYVFFKATLHAMCGQSALSIIREMLDLGSYDDRQMGQVEDCHLNLIDVKRTTGEALAPFGICRCHL